MEDMLKNLTLDQLKQVRPDLVAALRSWPNREALDQERHRIVAILSYHCKYYADLNKEELNKMLFEAVQTGWLPDLYFQRTGAVLQGILETAPVPGADETKNIGHLDRAKAYQKIHGCSLTDALKVTAPARIVKSE